MLILEELQVDYVNSRLKLFLNTKIEINKDYNMPKSVWIKDEEIKGALV